MEQGLISYKFLFILYLKTIDFLVTIIKKNTRVSLLKIKMKFNLKVFKLNVVKFTKVLIREISTNYSLFSLKYVKKL